MSGGTYSGLPQSNLWDTSIIDSSVSHLKDATRGQVAGPALVKTLRCFYLMVMLWAGTPLISLAFMHFVGPPKQLIPWWCLWIIPLLFCEYLVVKIVMVAMSQQFNTLGVVPKFGCISLPLGLWFSMYAVLSALTHMDFLTNAIAFAESMTITDDIADEWTDMLKRCTFPFLAIFPFKVCAFAGWLSWALQAFFGVAAFKPIYGFHGCGFKNPRGRDGKPKDMNYDLTASDLHDAVVYDTLMKKNGGHVVGLTALTLVCRMSAVQALFDLYDDVTFHTTPERRLILPAVAAQRVWSSTWKLMVFSVAETCFQANLQVWLVTVDPDLSTQMCAGVSGVVSCCLQLGYSMRLLQKSWSAVHGIDIHQEFQSVAQDKHWEPVEEIWGIFLVTKLHSLNADDMSDAAADILAANESKMNYLHKTVIDGLAAQQTFHRLVGYYLAAWSILALFTLKAVFCLQFALRVAFQEQ